MCVITRDMTCLYGMFRRLAGRDPPEDGAGFHTRCRVGVYKDYGGRALAQPYFPFVDRCVFNVYLCVHCACH